MGYIHYILSYFFLILMVVVSVKAKGYGGSSQQCDMFTGKWVVDESYPLYKPTSTCPFIEREFRCEANGRPDLIYTHYRWQPLSCNLLRFDGQDFLERMRGKSIMFVGDSLSRNQWQSLTCLLHSAVPNSSYTVVRVGDVSIFTFTEYEVKVMLDRNVYLVDVVREDIGRVLKLDSIQGSKLWKGIDMLIFNTWHWWYRRGPTQPWDYIQVGNQVMKDMDRMKAFERALTTWARWVDANIDPAKVKVFFQGISPSHYKFDGGKFLERYKGKKILFVGDSISNNMWQSLTCLLHIAIPNANYTLTKQTNQLTVFSIPEYEASIMWLKNGFLVDLVHDKEKGRILRLDTISSGNQWKGFDVLIFNTYHWWTHTGKSQTWDYFQVGNELIKEMDHLEAFKIGLSTWAKWVDSNIEPSKTRVLFQGIAASHVDGKGCLRQTKPDQGPMPPYPGVDTVKTIISKMEKPVQLLDITLLTQLRRDGHPSIYTGRGESYVDCSHWCLAGVPDTWNEMLYAALLED